MNGRNGLKGSTDRFNYLVQGERYVTNEGNTYGIKHDSNGKLCFTDERNGKLTPCATLIADQDINGLRRLQ